MNSITSRFVRVARFAIWAIAAVSPVIAQDNPHYSGSEVRNMMKEAATADQCRTLATWFRHEEVTFRGKAESEEKDYEQYKAMLIPAKFPTRADNALGMRNYYSYKANQMASRAARYEIQLARLDSSYRPHTGTASPAGAPTVQFPAPLSPNEQVLLDRVKRLEQRIELPREQ